MIATYFIKILLQIKKKNALKARALGSKKLSEKN
jgi:hypothetical protein